MSIPGTHESQEYRQVLSQLHFYLNELKCRYGYIITNKELLVVKKSGRRYGELLVAEPVPWGQCVPKVTQMLFNCLFIPLTVAAPVYQHPHIHVRLNLSHAKNLHLPGRLLSLPDAFESIRKVLDCLPKGNMTSGPFTLIDALPVLPQDFFFARNLLLELLHDFVFVR